MSERQAVSTGNLLFRRRRPLITYGRKDTKPLPLTAKHFRNDSYAFPVHGQDHGEDDSQSIALPTKPPASVSLNAAAGNEPESGTSDHPSDGSSDDLNVSEPLLKSTGTETTTAGAVTHRVATAIKTLENPANVSDVESIRRSDSPPPQKRTKRGSKSAASKPIITKASRRLPVNELTLIASRVDDDCFAPPTSSKPGIQIQDPISDHTSSCARQHSSLTADVEEQGGRIAEGKRSLSTFKSRLRSTKSRFKSVSDLRNKSTQKTLTSSTSSSAKSGDGFESGELFVSPLARKAIRRRRPRQDPLISGLCALQLQSGPLPDVGFEANLSPFRVEQKPPPSDNGGTGAPPKSARRVSFRNKAREEAFMSQLSSISAPPVPRPEVDDSDEVQDDDEDDEEAENDEDLIVDGFQVNGEEEVEAGSGEDESPEADNEIDRSLETHADEELYGGIQPPLQPISRSSDLQTSNAGVSLDFRRLAPRQLPRRRIRPHERMEVKENIIKVPDSDDLSGPRPQSYNHAVADVDTSPSMLERPRSHLKRPRSILKNASQVVFDSATEPEHTAANTRRNSTVELSESRYFTDVADMLRHADPTKHRIVPRRRSSYFIDNHAELLDSDAMVPETSPSPEPGQGMLDYVSTSGLAVLRNTSEAEWTSQSLPGPPRDLRILTREVSRQHRTLSQSSRRRPSVPFQSPTKIG